MLFFWRMAAVATALGGLAHAAAPLGQHYLGGERLGEFALRHKEATKLYHQEHDAVGALALFEEYERDSLAAGFPYWAMCAVWKQAQIHGDAGRKERSVELFEEARRLMKLVPAESGGANYFLLSWNLIDGHRGLGRLGRAARHLAEAGETLRYYCESVVPVAADEDVFLLGPERLERMRVVRFCGNVFLAEAMMRFESGRDEEALRIANDIEQRVKVGTIWWEDQLRQKAQWLQVGWLDLLERAKERDAVEARLLVAPGEPRHGSLYWRMARLAQTERLHAEGGDAEPLFARMAEDLDNLRRTNRIPAWIVGRARLARMHGRDGAWREAEAILSADIAEATGLEMPLELAELYLTRATLRMDREDLRGVEADLVAALEWFRRHGGLRREAEAFAGYARFLRMSGRLVEAQLIRGEAAARLRQFAHPALRRRLAEEAASMARAVHAAGGAGAAGRGGVATARLSDLQPLEAVSLVAKGETARARFTVTNPSSAAEEGELIVRGPGLSAVWDAGALSWRVEADTSGAAGELRQTLRLEPLDQARVWLSRRGREQAGVAEVALSWRSAEAEQTAWWRSRGVDGGNEAMRMLGNENLALNNAFYAVPLHHVWTLAAQRSAHAGGAVNMRARASVPCRVELVREADGRVLAVDAQGDGRFDGEGDVVLSDRDGDGFPDFSPKGSEEGLELYVYVSGEGADLAVELDAKRAGEDWVPQTVDRVLRE